MISSVNRPPLARLVLFAVLISSSPPHSLAVVSTLSVSVSRPLPLFSFSTYHVLVALFPFSLFLLPLFFSSLPLAFVVVAVVVGSFRLMSRVLSF